MMKAMEIGKIRDKISQADSKVLSLDVYRETGCFVVRGVIPEDQITFMEI